jgi:hypothetical protein
MQHKRTIHIGGGEPLPDLTDASAALRASGEALAAALARHAFADDPGASVNSIDVFSGIATECVGAERTRLLRRLAESWQMLEISGSVCRDPEAAQGTWWFLTARGRSLLATSAPVDTLKGTLGR